MPNNYFQFKQFTIKQDGAVFKVGTDGVLLGSAADVNSSKNILEVGAGTGLISLMIAQRCSAQIFALEPEPESFIKLVENISNCPWKSRIFPVNISLQEYSTNIKFDTIISNPPFFVDSLKNPDLLKSSARHNVSLDHNDILRSTADLLENDGTLQVILPYAEGTVFIAKATDYGLYCNDLLKIKPVPGSDIKRLIIKLSRKKTIVHESFMTIENSRHNYTEEYRNLTKDFYLNF